MKVYFISGLAADRRVFTRVRLPEGFEAVFLEWLSPMPGESLTAYACRLSEGIDQREPYVLAGLSMGGMIAGEIARRFSPVQTILISSIAAPSELPPYFRWAGKMRLHKFVSPSFVKSAAAAKRLFTTESKEDKKLLAAIIRDSDPVFIRWAMDAILHWETSVALPSSWVHIHGTADPVLPLRFTHPTETIKGAGHLAVLTHSREVNDFLRRVLEKIKTRNATGV